MATVDDFEFVLVWGECGSDLCPGGVGDGKDG